MNQMAACKAKDEIVETRAQRQRTPHGAVDNPPVYPEVRISAAEFAAILRAALTYSEAIGIIRARTKSAGLRYDLPFYSRVDRPTGDFVAQNVPARTGRGTGAYA
ncbi:MAG: hypothetical protein LLG06_11685 [Desulfobacteraceae bacterium]|nr:hypothetical protein [Desulfobacteraceae bacterium]